MAAAGTACPARALMHARSKRNCQSRNNVPSWEKAPAASTLTIVSRRGATVKPLAQAGGNSLVLSSTTVLREPPSQTDSETQLPLASPPHASNAPQDPGPPDSPPHANIA